ncbi:MAG TPA: TIGR00341 family protein [Methylophilus sp.]|nr:TIGR00341 family protein [Methylophilus sp.]HQQ33113.1 TIGR00341 family protein [Methylophilus sp.]
MQKNRTLKWWLISIRRRFSLIEDKASDQVIDTGIRSGVELRGTNLWVLMFAIFIASIGLNVNSTAVIIGAMLISPLMGPIMGVGYGIGIYDAELIRKSLRNLGIATSISLLVSTLYFLLTPLSDAQSELLARTSPTIWDVLIAFFGGMAGIIGATRAEKTNIIPGVAIATALMPPLCTAGYGLANLNWQFFFGAFYLFSINCVFIAFSAVLIIWILNPEHKKFVDRYTETKIRRTLSLIVLVTMLPSIYLALHLVKNEVFTHKSKAFIAQEFSFANTRIASSNIDPVKKRIELTLIGELIKQQKLQEIESKLAEHGLKNANLLVYQAQDQALDVTALKENIVSDLYKTNLLALEQKNKALEDMKTRLGAIDAEKASWQAMSAELGAQYPQISEIYLSTASKWQKGDSSSGKTLIVLNIRTASKLNKQDVYRITEWLKVRAKTDQVKVVIE